MQALKSCYTSSPPLHTENEGAGEVEREKDMQILWHEDAQGTSRLEQKGDSHSQHQQIQHDLRLGKISIPFLNWSQDGEY